MKKNPHIITIINGIILIAAGLFSYFSNPERPFTALIGPIIGIILVGLSPFIKKGNKTIAHFVALITLLFAIQTGIMAFNSKNVEDIEKRNRRIAVFSIMSLSCFAATGLYTYRFIALKKEKEANNNQ